MATEIELKKEERDVKAKQLADIMEEARTDNPKVLDLSKVKSVTGSNEEKRLEIKRRNDELSGLGVQIDLYQVKSDLEKIKAAPAAGVPLPGGRDEYRSLGEIFATSAERKEFGNDPSRWTRPIVVKDYALKDMLSGFEMKTTMSTSAGWAPQAIRTPRVVDIATRPIQVLDSIPTGNTSQSALVFIAESTFTNNAAETTENNAYPENAFALTETTVTVRKVAAFVPVTDEQLEDVDQVQSYINNRLTFSLRQRLDGQVLVGDGNAPNLKGVQNAANIQTQAKGADSTPAAIYKAMVKVRVTGRAQTSAVYIHPNDWQDIRLLTTADGIFLWGSPSDAGPERIWGVPVIQTDVLTENTALLGDFATFSELVYRRGLELSVGFINDDFKLGKKSIRADVRAAMCTYRGAAFCTVTGI